MLDTIVPPFETIPKECRELIEKIVNSGLLLYTYYFESKDRFVIRFSDELTLKTFQKIHKEAVESPISEVYYNISENEYTIRLVRITNDSIRISLKFNDEGYISFVVSPINVEGKTMLKAGLLVEKLKDKNWVWQLIELFYFHSKR